MVLRKRSMSVFVPKNENRLSRKFEGVVSDNDAQTDSEEEEDRFLDGPSKSAAIEEEDETLSESWTRADYDLLLEKLRAALPKKDTKKFTTTFELLKWQDIEIRNHSTGDIKRMAKSLISKIRRFRTLGEVLDDVPEVIQKLMSADKPKAPLSAYNLYVKENQSRLREENPDIKMPEVFKLLSKGFHGLTEKKLRKYEDAANHMRAEYQASMKKYYENHPEMVPQKAVRKSKAVNKTPFNLFFQSRREVSTNISMQQARKEWEELPMKKKLKFIRASFEEETAGKLLNKKEQEMLDRFHGKPEYVGRNPFDFFKRKVKPQLEASGLTGMDRERKVGEEYKKLTDRQALELKEEYTAAREEYITQYRAFIRNLPKEKQQVEIEYLQGLTDKGKKEKNSKKVADKVQKEEEVYPGSADEDPPVAESTTIKKPAKNKKKELPTVSPEEEDEEESPSKRAKMAPPASPKKIPAKLPETSKVKKTALKKNVKTDSSSDELTTTVVAAAASTSSLSNNGSVVKSEPTRSAEEVAAAAAQLEKIAGMKKSRKKKIENPEPSTKPVAPVEPERPPKQIEEFYRQRIYKGKVGKHKESFANLSAAKRREISEQMKEAQKQYIVDFENYLKSLPRDEIRRYIQKVNAQKKDETGSDDDEEEDDEDEEEDATGSSSEEEDEDD